MDFVNALVISLILSIGFMGGVYYIGKQIGRYDVVDMAWGLVFIVIASGALFYDVTSGGGNIHWGKFIMLIVVCIWGARLATHIGYRLQRTKSEDPRYIALRSKWKGNEERNIFVRIFMVQALLAVGISLPVIAFLSSSFVVVPEFIVAGAIVWLLGFIIESVADLQLEAFVITHPNTLMTKGLWKYSRHPNYFGEIVQWSGIGIMALSIDYGWVTLVGPLLLTFFLLYVSGVPLAEKRSARHDGWERYKRRTSVLFPMPPIKS